MIPEIGNFALSLALALAVLLSIEPLRGLKTGNVRSIAMGRPLTYALFGAMLVSFLCLAYGFAVNDFSVAYIVNHSNSELPIYFRIAAVWGGHEGSLLLWILLLASWTLAIALFSKQMPEEDIARVLAVMGMVSVGFLLFVVFTSNPFTRTLPDFPLDGRDLNPLLQDIGLIFHPPLLYMGYVGYSVVFAFAIASLLAGRLDTAWARWSRPWAIAAWVFLTLGIALGSYWAYYELGWGGWWFWDPVENASLMPWITGTALMHSLAVSEKRGTFKAWTVLLAITSFSLCLLGTFLVRSGILVSVHSFSSDPSRGMMILIYLLVVVGGSLLLYALKGGQLNKSYSKYELFSRETMLVGNNILLIAAMLVVLLGTLLPLVHKQIGLGSISIGAPFFNTMFIWLMIPFAFLLGVGPLVRWRRDEPSRLVKRLVIAIVISIVAALVLPLIFQDHIVAMTVLGLIMAMWIIVLALMELHERATHRHGFWQGLTHVSRSHWGMVIAHLGVAVMVIGIAFSENYSIERDVRMHINDAPSVIRDYEFTLKGVREVQGPNYVSDMAEIEIKKAGRVVTTLYPEKRYYRVQSSMMTEAAIDSGITRDLYIAMGERLDGNSWSVRLHYKPFVNWIWFGSLLMAIGGTLSIFDWRYRLRNRRAEPVKGAKLHEE